MHSILYNNAKRNSDFTNVKNYILNRNSITISNDVFIFSASLFSLEHQGRCQSND